VQLERLAVLEESVLLVQLVLRDSLVVQEILDSLDRQVLEVWMESWDQLEQLELPDLLD
jgi:hypothetical protein